MATLPTIRDVDAERVLPGDTLLRHPDNPDRQGEWTITHVRRVGDGGAHIRLDYTDGAAVGCFIVSDLTRVTIRTGSVCDWLDGLTDDEARSMLAFLSGYTRESIEHALADIQERRDYRACRAQRRAEEATAA